MNINKQLIFFLFLVFSSVFACAGGEQGAIKQALDLTNSEHYDEAYRILKPLAEQGNPRAEHRLGDLMVRKNPKNKYYDLKLGLAWMEKAADTGDAAAQWSLTKIMTYDPIYQEDRHAYFKESFKWLSKSAEQGYAMAQLDIADYYANERGGAKQDYVKAYMYYELANRRFKNTSDKKESLTDDLSGYATGYQQDLIKNGHINPEQQKKAIKLADEWEKKHPNAYKTWPIPSL